MSRIGKMPVAVPQGVDVQIKQDQISVKGAGGTLSLAQNSLVKVTSESGKLSFVPANDPAERANPGSQSHHSQAFAEVRRALGS